MNPKIKETDYILNAIEMLIDAKIKKLHLSQSFISKVTAYDEKTGLYTVVCRDGQQRNIKNISGQNIPIGKNVWVMIPDGDTKKMHIYGVA